LEQPVRVAYGDYKPDLAGLVNDGLEVASNTVPITGGYAGISSLSDLSGFTALDARPRGAIAGIDVRGNPFNFAGTEDKLYELRTDTLDVSGPDAPYNCTGDTYWEFAVFGDSVIAVNIQDIPQYYTLGSGQPFAQLGNPLTTNTVAPRASHIGVIGSFVVLGGTIDSINGEDPAAIHWSALNDPFNWPTPGSDVARAVQSGRQSLIGDGGAVQRVVSGAEVGAIFQERSIWRADYRGGDVVFQLDKVEPRRGLLIPAVAVPFGRQVFYLSEDGFYIFDGTTSTPIGREIIDRTFLADVDASLFDRVSATADPDSQRIWILYPGSGHDSAGTPNKILIYDWGLDRFTHGELDAEWITQAIDAGVHLDSPGIVGDPNDTTDDPVYPDGGVDGPGLPSFDARQAPPGALKLGAYSTTFFLQDFSGSGLAATLETGRRELIPGSRSLANSARTMVDAVDPTVQVAGTSRTNDSGTFSKASRIDDDGSSHFRVDGRFHQFRVNLPGGFNNALFMDVYCQRSGRR
jgi:hypothetical protein